MSESEVSAYVDEIKQAGYTYEANETKASDMYSYNAWNRADISDGSAVIITYTNEGTFDLNVTNYAIM